MNYKILLQKKTHYVIVVIDLSDTYARALRPVALELGHIYQANSLWP